MATEQVVEAAAGGLEAAAGSLERSAIVARRINPGSVGLFAAGLGTGVVIGFVIGYRYNRSKIRAEVLKEADSEMLKLRTYYHEKYEGGERVVPEKPSVDDVMREKQYDEATTSYMQPPPGVVTPERPLKPQVPVVEPPARRQYAPPPPAYEKNTDDGWDFAKELAQRTKERPYVIHQDEFMQGESGFSRAAITYWEADDVLADEDNTIINNRDNLVGEENLRKWGHGSDDFNVVFVRNEELQIEYEISRTPRSYEQEIVGLSNDEAS